MRVRMKNYLIERYQATTQEPITPQQYQLLMNIDGKIINLEYNFNGYCYQQLPLPPALWFEI
jgi:hypothetical protein